MSTFLAAVFMAIELMTLSVKLLASQIIETVRTFTTSEEVIVKWVAFEPEVTEYVVEWYEELETDPFSRSWQYVSNSTSWKTNRSMFIYQLQL